MNHLLAMGVGACFAGSGALAWAAARVGRRAPSREGAPAARLYVSDVEAASAASGPAALHGGYGPADVIYLYCPAELRTTAHVEDESGALRCWRLCPPEGTP